MPTSPTVTRSGAGPQIFGRERELTRLYELVDEVPKRGAALLVRGEPGIGKSTLLVAARQRAEAAGMQVLHMAGVQSEAELPFAGLHQLVSPLLGQLDQLPSPQRTALLAAFGMVEAAEAPDRFLIALAVLELLSEAAEQTMLLVIAEDAQWLDRSTVGVLAFVARRIEHEKILVLAASREGTEGFLSDAGLPEMRLGGLNEDAAEALLDKQGKQLAPAWRGRLLEQAYGNPLALVELPLMLDTEDPGSHPPSTPPPPLTQRLERAFAAETAKLPSRTRTLMLLASANDGDALSEILAAHAVIDSGQQTAEGFLPAIDARLVEIDGGRLLFHHPLVRSAVYQAAGVVERNVGHAALATVLAGQPDRQVWHRAAALVGPDERVAAALDATAMRARRRGAISVAINALERAVKLSEDRMRQGRRLLDAAELEFELGRGELVQRLVKEAEGLQMGTTERHRMTLVRAMFDQSVPDDAASLRSMVVATRQAAQDGDVATSISLLTQVAHRCYWSSPQEGVRELVIDTAVQLRIGDESAELMVILALADPVRCAARVLEVLSLTPPDRGDANTARLLGLAASVVGDPELAVPFLTVSVRGLRPQGRLTWLSHVLTMRAWAYVHLGRWDLATPDAEEAVRLADETGQSAVAARARAAKAILAGMRDEAEEAHVLAAEAEHMLLPKGLNAALWDVQLARGLIALGDTRYVDSYDHLNRMFERQDPAWHDMKRCWAIGDLAEAARYSGHLAEARALLPEMEAVLNKTRSPRLRIALEYARPLLAEDDEAEGLFRTALGTDLTRWPFARARLELAFGAWLRRQRRVVESRVPLRAAQEAFDALGALPWGERARNELRSAGVSSRPRERSSMEELTPQELQIARMAASGLSNREIGQQLYISHRTVGAHLHNVFPKLGITSRGELRDAVDTALP